VSRESRPRQKTRTASSKSGGGIIVGIFIGLILGGLCAAGAAWYFTRHSPFQPQQAAPATPAGQQQPIALPGKPGDRPVAKQDFEFYRVLPQGVDAGTDPRPTPPAQAPARAERLYLQVGAFENPAEADNMKALLTLNGIDASAQRAQLPDGRIVHRVRVGPFSKPEDMNPVRARLASAGFTATVVRSNP